MSRAKFLIRVFFIIILRIIVIIEEIRIVIIEILFIGIISCIVWVIHFSCTFPPPRGSPCFASRSRTSCCGYRLSIFIGFRFSAGCVYFRSIMRCCCGVATSRTSIPKKVSASKKIKNQQTNDKCYHHQNKKLLKTYVLHSCTSPDSKSTFRYSITHEFSLCSSPFLFCP